MKSIHRVPLATLLLLLTLLSAPSAQHRDADTRASAPKLLFRSGFEAGVNLLKPRQGYQVLRGLDSSTGFRWPISVLGSNPPRLHGPVRSLLGNYAEDQNGLHLVDDPSGLLLHNEIQTVVGHDGNLTRALFNFQAGANGATQTPYEILNVKDGRKDLYIRYWMKMDAASLHQVDKWRAIFEWKTEDYAKGTGFRLIAFVYTDLQGHAYWHWQGDANPMSPVWEIDNFAVPVPENEWFLTEFFWHWSEGPTGRALWRVNGQVIGDHFGPTTRNSKPIDFIMMTQLYGDANPKHQWIDDIEIWDGLAY
ncbi:MAG TPA: hypothetical protein ENJ09_07280 [Planctomycetes bacterium]|nr:hypothetical protein [Planctomycetota bacterium]